MSPAELPSAPFDDSQLWFYQGTPTSAQARLAGALVPKATIRNLRRVRREASRGTAYRRWATARLGKLRLKGFRPNGERLALRAWLAIALLFVAPLPLDVQAAQLAEDPADTIRVLDCASLRILHVPSAGAPAGSIDTDVAIAGGGLGGVAAALALCDAGYSVALTEETRWLGGQISAQGVSALDENYWIEGSGATRRYQELRSRIRQHYRAQLAVPDTTSALDPGGCWVSGLAFEPRVGEAAIEATLQPAIASGKLTVLRRCKAYRVNQARDRIESLDVVDLDSDATQRLRAKLFLDATELGELLALGDIEHRVGAESQAETAEPHAPAAADPACVQAFTYSLILERRPGEGHALRGLPDCGHEDPPWAAPADWIQAAAGAAEPTIWPPLFTPLSKQPGSLWTYRRLVDASQFRREALPHDLSLINLPAIDYRGGSLLAGTPEDQLHHLQAARQLSYCFLQWLQRDAPRADGGRGYPELRLATDAFGTDDGLPMFPYIRESRRIVALTTIREQDVAAASLPGELRGRFFNDSVGIGHYGLDLHAGPCDEPQLAPATRPFQIPMGALVPVRVRNLLPACKNIGTTHITASCYRLHPIEWAIGEAAGAIAVECLATGLSTQELHAKPSAVRAIQERLLRGGAPIFWYTNRSPGAPDFVEAQRLPFQSPVAREQLWQRSDYPDREVEP